VCGCKNLFRRFFFSPSRLPLGGLKANNDVENPEMNLLLITGMTKVPLASKERNKEKEETCKLSVGNNQIW
jgi:hypothetical protein